MFRDLRKRARRVEIQRLLYVCWNALAEIGWMAQLGSFLRKDSKFHGKPKATSKHSSPTLTPPLLKKVMWLLNDAKIWRLLEQKLPLQFLYKLVVPFSVLTAEERQYQQHWQHRKHLQQMNQE